ncbi:HTTM domain-containing protein, partial [Natronomonas salsuginis]
AGLFVFAAVVAVAFLLGYRTRLVGAISLLLLVSLHVRYPMVLNGGDRLLRVLLLVALLTPLGERWSVDALRRGDIRRRVASVGTVALLCQPVVVFTTNAVEKHRGEHWYAGDGLELALSDPTMTTELGAQLLAYPPLLTALNYAWVALLAGAAGFLLLTVGRLRTLAALAYLGAFVGIGLSLSVGLFPFALAASVLPFVATPFWDRLPGSDLRACLGSHLVRFVPSTGRPRSPLDASRARPIATALSVVVLAWMLGFAGVDVAGVDPPEPLDSEHLDQQDWGLYAPDPAESYSWHVVVAEREDGSTVGLDGGSGSSFDRPPDASAAYETFRHRRFASAVDGSARVDGPLADRYAEWGCERAMPTGGDIESVAVYRLHRSKRIDGDDTNPQRVTILDRACR